MFNMKKKIASILAAAVISILAIVPLAGAENAAATTDTAAAPVAVAEETATQETTAAATTAETLAAATATETAAATTQTVADQTTVTKTAAKTMTVYSSNGLSVNMRSSRTMTTNRNIIARLKFGQSVTVLSDTGDWMYVSTTVNGKTLTGYVRKAFLVDGNAADLKNFQDVSAFQVTVKPTAGRNGYVNLRAAATTAASRIRKMRLGEKLTVLAQNDSWYMVTDNYGYTGYVAKAYVKA